MSPAALADPPRPRGKRGLRYVLVLLILILGGACLWTWLTLSWAYADGIRAGVLQKIVHRGWVCKTIEGSLAQYVIPGISPQIWQFSIRDPAVAAQLGKSFAGHPQALNWVETQYALVNLSQLMSPSGQSGQSGQNAQQTSSKALNAVSLADPTGITGVAAAFDNPKCKLDDPFPSVKLLN